MAERASPSVASAWDGSRVILHVDMDAFFASVEQLDEPELRGKPVLVGGDGRRGVVAAASYEARAFGCRSAMPMATAKRLCPDAVVVRGRFERYRELSKIVMGVLNGVTPLVQPLSIDEAFCDITGSVRLLGPPVEIARSVRASVLEQTGLICSAGVAPNKFLAKLASDLDKPDGLVVIEPGTEHAVLDPLPVSRLWGVGKAAARKLASAGLRTIGDIRAAGDAVLTAHFGDFGLHLARLSRGEDDRPVTPDRVAKSISHEKTFGENLTSPADVRAVMGRQAEDVCRRLRTAGRVCRAVVVKIRFGDFETVTRTRALPEPTDETGAIRAAAWALFDAWCAEPAGFRSVRLIGVGVQQLAGPGVAADSDDGGGDAAEQLGLFDAEERAKRRAVDRLTDAIAAKHGKDAVRRGG